MFCPSITEALSLARYARPAKYRMRYHEIVPFCEADDPATARAKQMKVAAAQKRDAATRSKAQADIAGLQARIKQRQKTLFPGPKPKPPLNKAIS